MGLGSDAPRQEGDVTTGGLDAMRIGFGGNANTEEHSDTIRTSLNGLNESDSGDDIALLSEMDASNTTTSVDQPDPVTVATNRLRNIKPGDVPREATIDVIFYGLHRDGHCIDGWRSKACFDNIVRYASGRQQNGTVILVVVARGRYNVVLNWCVSMQRIGLDNYMLVALDDDAQGFFSKKGAPVVPLPRAVGEGKVYKSDVWILRTFIAYMILNEGINVLISDADAVMMKSPFGNPLSHFDDKSSDIITSPSNFPNPTKGELPDACRSAPPGEMEWRHWPCMGWTFLKSSKRMYVFFVESFLRDVIRYRDDQIGFNCAIRKAGAEWNDGTKWDVNKTVKLRTKTPKLKLLMLPSAQFVRNCTEFQDDKERGYGIHKFDSNAVQLYHCKGSNKMANAQNNDFWFLKDNWERVEEGQSTSFRSYLNSISI